MNETESKRSSLVDLLRILAFSLILAGHSAQSLHLSWGQTHVTGFYDIGLGKLGITLFLVISGMVLRLNDRNQGVMAFSSRRLQRIYPVYWMALTLSIAMGLVFHWDNFPKDWMEGTLTITGFCAFAGLWGCSLLPWGWFIGLILSLYILYPWLSSLMNRAPRVALIALLLISVVSRLIVDDYVPYRPREWFPLCRVFEFGFGIYLAQEAQPWSALRWTAPAPISKILEILSELSFPAFLIHWVFLPVYWHLGSPLHVLVFLVMTMSTSYVVLSVDSYLQQALFGTRRSSCSPVVFKLSAARKAWNSLVTSRQDAVRPWHRPDRDPVNTSRPASQHCVFHRSDRA
ncbi:MAG: acyltransferase family protein [Nitrospiraceae bacterium]